MPSPRVATPRRLAALLVAPLLLLPLVLATPAAAVSPDLVVSQVYGGGGNSGATYTHDFIEIYNRGTAPASLGGMSLQYASATGTGFLGANSGQLTELPDISLQPGKHYLVQEASGGTAGVALPHGDTSDSTPINMSGANGKVALATGTNTLGCNGSTGQPCNAAALARIVDLVGYGNANFFEGTGAAPTLTNSTAAIRQSDGAQDTDDNRADFIAGAPTPRNTGNPPPPVPTCDESGVTPISQVQGSGNATPLAGQTVLVEAVVTANRPGLSGFFLQEEAGDVDGDAQTSEGVFVSGSLPTGAEVGDVVRTRGVAQEDFGKTRISATGSVECGVDTAPAPEAVTFPVASPTFLERYEGMLVTFPQDLVISEYFNYDRFGETVVGLPKDGLSRFFTPTAVTSPGTAANALAAEYALRRITLDDGRNAQNPSPTYFPGTVDDEFTLENRFRGGDTLSDTTGVLDFSFGLYRVHPTADATYTSVNQRPEQPPVVGGDVTVGSFNVLNYFLTLDEAPTRGTCGPAGNQDCRGADNAVELARQRAKIVDAIARLDADVVGLMEMENTAGVEPAADLVAGLNDKLGAGTYDFVDTGVVGTDAIRTGFLYQPGSVRPVGDFAVLDSSVDPRFLDTKNRPALAQSFDQVGTGNRFTVAVNHLKSKGSDCNDVGDPDTRDGQGNCNVTRTEAAKALADWLASDPTSSGDPDRLIIGDLNSYDHEDPIAALESAGYTDLVEQFGGEYAYGYVFDGQVGYLDHGLANASLQPQVTGASEWHLNADEPDLLDYDTSFKGPNEDALYEPNAFRSSDHDAVLIGLDLHPATPGACYTGDRQSVDSFDQGGRLNGTSVPPSMSDPRNALGLSDPGDDPYWTGLGLGGSLVIRFDQAVQNNNLTSPDLRIVDAPDGAKGRADTAEVYTSWDGTSWSLAGTVSGTGSVDLDPFIAVRYVKVVDTTPTAGLPDSADGYDLDAIEVLSGCSA